MQSLSHFILEEMNVESARAYHRISRVNSAILIYFREWHQLESTGVRRCRFYRVSLDTNYTTLSKTEVKNNY